MGAYQESIDMDELADKSIGELAKSTSDMIAETKAKWVEDDHNLIRAFNRDRAELIAITEITFRRGRAAEPRLQSSYQVERGN